MRICTKCDKETLDTPCPYCGGGVFKVPKIEVPICSKCKVDDGRVGHYPSGWVCEVCGDIEPDFIFITKE